MVADLVDVRAFEYFLETGPAIGRDPSAGHVCSMFELVADIADSQDDADCILVGVDRPKGVSAEVVQVQRTVRVRALDVFAQRVALVLLERPPRAASAESDDRSNVSVQSVH